MFRIIGYLLIFFVAFCTLSILLRVPSAPLLVGCGVVGALLLGATRGK